MAVKRWNGTSWDTYSANPNLNNTLSQWKKTAAGGETTLSGNDDSSINLAYTVGQESVYINGVLQVRGSDYTATNGSSIVLTNQLVAGNIVQVISPLLIPMSSVIPLSTIAAKGDLMIGTASSVPARLPIGANDQVLVADSTSSNGMAWKSYGAQNYAGKNFVINGAFDIWQRGTSVTMGNAVYTADRWLSFTDSASNRTVTRQLTNDSINLPNIQYCARVQRTAGDTGTGRYVIGGGNETSMSIPLAGQTVTLSFYARAGVNYSVSGNLLGVNLQYGTGTDQNVFVGYTGNTNLIATTKTLTTTWQRFSVTGTFPATATEIGWAFNSVGSPTGTAGTNDYYEITGVQLELGSTATPFSRAGGDIQGELAKCQRYYYRTSPATTYGQYCTGYGRTSSVAEFVLPLQVRLRTNSVSLEWSTLAVHALGNTLDAVTALTIGAGGYDSINLSATTAANLTLYRPYSLGNNGSNGYIGISAEL